MSNEKRGTAQSSEGTPQELDDAPGLGVLLNPEGLHDPSPFGYSHTVRLPAVAELVLVSGQYGSNRVGAVVSSEFDQQVRQAFHNLELALSAHGLRLRDVVQLRTYVVEHDLQKLRILGEALGRLWGLAPPTQTLLGVSALAMPEILFEVEAVACRARGQSQCYG